MKNLKSFVLIVLLAASVGFNFWQAKRIKELQTDQAKLREENALLATSQKEYAGLLNELSTAKENSQVQVQELARLRARVNALSKSEQENARLRSENQAMQQALVPAQAPQAPLPEDEEVKQQKFLQARLSFGKNLAMALLVYASEHNGALPEDPTSVTTAVGISQEFADHGFKSSDYEFMPHTSLAAVKESSRTLFAKDKNPIRLRDGQVCRSYVYVDGHVELHKGNSVEELVAWEQEHFNAP